MCAHLLVTLLRRSPLIGWAIGPLGVTAMFLHEPSTSFILLNVLFPALVSAGTLYVGLFTLPGPITFPHHSLLAVLIVVCGVLITSTADVLNAVRDLRYPLWGEARVLLSIQFLRASWAKIHFTRFGYDYLNDHFSSQPTELLQAL